MDDKTIRVLRDIANAVVIGIRKAQADAAGYAPADAPAHQSQSPFQTIFAHAAHVAATSRAINPVEFVDSVCSELVRALNEHLPENGKAKD